MSDVEKYYEAIRKKWPTPTKPWEQLGVNEQLLVMQSINMLLQVLQQQ